MVTVVCDCICGINMHAASEILLGSVMESEFGSLVFRGQKLIREVHKSLEWNVADGNGCTQRWAQDSVQRQRRYLLRLMRIIINVWGKKRDKQIQGTIPVWCLCFVFMNPAMNWIEYFALQNIFFLLIFSIKISKHYSNKSIIL